GLYCEDGAPQISACVFRYNSANYGGGLGLRRCSAVATNCSFHDNFGEFYGAVIATQGLPIFDGCTFTANRCAKPSYGGALGASVALITNCQFFQNSAPGGYGGAIVTGPNTTIERCLFQGNSADEGGAINGRRSFVIANSFRTTRTGVRSSSACSAQACF